MYLLLRVINISPFAIHQNEYLQRRYLAMKPKLKCLRLYALLTVVTLDIENGNVLEMNSTDGY